MSFHLPQVYIICRSRWPGKLRNCFVSWQNKSNWKWTHKYAYIFQVIREQVHSQYFSVCKSISVKGDFINHFNIFKPSAIHMSQFYSHLSDDIDQYASNYTTHLCIITCLFISKGFITSFHVRWQVWLRKDVLFHICYSFNILYLFRILYHYWQIYWCTSLWKVCCWWF